MKKYIMLTLTILVIIMTIACCLYKNVNLPENNYNCAEINFEAKKFGSVHNIIWSPLDDSNIIFLAEGANSKSSRSELWLYAADIETGEVRNLYQFTRHMKLGGYIYMDNLSKHIFAASPQGLHEISIMDNYKIDAEFYFLDEFENADSLLVSEDRIAYTRSDKNLIYFREIRQNSDMAAQTDMPGYLQTFYKPSEKILMNTSRPSCTFYSQRQRDGLNIYKSDFNSFCGGIKDTLVAKNAVNIHVTQTIENSLLFLTEESNSFILYYGDKQAAKLPKNVDIAGMTPDFELREAADKRLLVYTSFDEGHKGTLYTCDEQEKHEEIVKDCYITGGVRISNNLKKIVFLTNENNNIRIKVYDINNKVLKDISEIFN